MNRIALYGMTGAVVRIVTDISKAQLGTDGYADKGLLARSVLFLKKVEGGLNGFPLMQCLLT